MLTVCGSICEIPIKSLKVRRKIELKKYIRATKW